MTEEIEIIWCEVTSLIAKIVTQIILLQKKKHHVTRETIDIFSRR